MLLFVDSKYALEGHSADVGDKPLALVVDSYLDNLSLLAQVLSFCGCAVLTAHDAAIALELVKTYPIGLIVTELVMPGAQGIDFVARLRQQTTAATPIIVLTSWVTPYSRQQARQAGCSEYIEKPYSVEELETLILTYLHLPPLD